MFNEAWNQREKKMGSFVTIKNVGRGEAIVRSVIGIMMILLPFFTPGVFQWILGLIGVVLILTTIFGY
jgi:hypothetical protein